MGSEKPGGRDLRQINTVYSHSSRPAPKEFTMSKVHRVAVLVGSLRTASINRKLALAMAELAPPSLQLDIVEIGDLPLYNEDTDVAPYPPAYQRFREQVGAADALLFVTPEYNRSIPAPMKNAIDVGSRPYGKSAFSGKPGAVLSASPGAIGGFGANHHLRQCLVFLDVPVLQQPEAYLGGAGAFFDEQGVLSDSIKPFLQKFIDAYAGWVEQHAKG
jgi:chromate reductase